jgi:hydrogenase maturation protease
VSEEHPARPILVFTYGNPSRGDDALGPAMHDMLREQQRAAGLLPDVELLTDFQLQIEHATDLQQRERVVFVDASLTAPPPYAFDPLHPEQDTSYTTHAMSPAAVLAVYQQIHQQPPPPAFLLSIRGYEFALGEPLSARARLHLQSAFEFLMEGQVLNLDRLTDV